MLRGKILITGGAGTLGRAIIRRAVDENWQCQITIFSTDAVKHAKVKARWPHIHSVIGDIRDFTTVHNAMSGKDIVIHAAATKEIPVGEYNSIDTFQVNVEGSLNVANAAIQHGIPLVIGISTDKACHPANAYGASKFLMEKTWQEYSRLGVKTSFNLVRYGNVLESTASVVEIWRNAIRDGGTVKMTNPAMTRFWLSPSQAVELINLSQDVPNGEILIPKLKSLSLKKLAEYVLPQGFDLNTVERIPMRPGEKFHETLLTIDEIDFTTESKDFFFLRDSLSERKEENAPDGEYSSLLAPEMSREELMELLDKN